MDISDNNLFLFQNPGYKLQNPWPMYIIDNFLPIEIANHLRDNWPGFKPGNDFIGNANLLGDQIWKKFYATNWVDKKTDIVKILDNIFNENHEDLNSEFSLRELNNNVIQIARDWHVDFESKKYHIMMYFGQKCPGGQFEARNKNKEILTVPFCHNRLLVWRNNADTEHRYWSCVGSRKTVSYPLVYSS